MDKSEFILIIPGIIYGVAMVDLLKIFRHSNKYWEGVAWGIAMFLNLIVSWFGLYDKIEIISANIGYFTIYIISPLLFAQAVFVLTPEEEHTDTKAYFIKTHQLFFILLLCYVALNSFLSFFLDFTGIFEWMRYALILPFIGAIILNKQWIRVLLLSLYYLFALIIFANGLI
jgi:hypothetical protein